MRWTSTTRWKEKGGTESKSWCSSTVPQTVFLLFSKGTGLVSTTITEEAEPVLTLA